MPKKKPGIYKIRNTTNNRVYVGSTAYLGHRKSSHWHYLRKNKHENAFLQNDWNKCGEEAFVYEIVLECDAEALLEEEQKWLDLLFDNQNQCYNIAPNAESCLGVTHTAERNHKLSVAMTGKKNPFYGKRHTKKAKQKISKANKGRLVGEKNPMYGRCGAKHPFWGKRGNKHHLSKRVVQFDPETGKKIKEFASLREAERCTKISNTTISRCCRGKQKTSGGWGWKFLNEE